MALSMSPDDSTSDSANAGRRNFEGANVPTRTMLTTLLSGFIAPTLRLNCLVAREYRKGHSCSIPSLRLELRPVERDHVWKIVALRAGCSATRPFALAPRETA